MERVSRSALAWEKSGKAVCEVWAVEKVVS